MVVPVLAAVSHSPPLSPHRLSPRRPSSPFTRSVDRQHAMPLLSGPLGSAVAAMKALQAQATTSQQVATAQHVIIAASQEGAAVQAVPNDATAAKPAAAAATPVAAEPIAVAQQAAAQSTQQIATIPMPTWPPLVNSQVRLAKSAAQPSSVVLQALASPPASAVMSASIAPNSRARPASPAPSHATSRASLRRENSLSTGFIPASFHFTASGNHTSIQWPPPSPSGVQEATNSLAALPSSPQQEPVPQQAMSAQEAAVAQQAAIVRQTVATQQASAAQQAPATQHASIATGPSPQANQSTKISKSVSFAER